MISIGMVAQSRGDIAPIKGTVPTGATWDQYIPIVDEDGDRIELADYTFELSFTDRDGNLELRLSTVTGEILKTTDDTGETLRVFASPSTLAGMVGPYTCTFATQDTSDQVWLLAKGIVVFLEAPPAFA